MMLCYLIQQCLLNVKLVMERMHSRERQLGLEVFSILIVQSSSGRALKDWRR